MLAVILSGRGRQQATGTAQSWPKCYRAAFKLNQDHYFRSLHHLMGQIFEPCTIGHFHTFGPSNCCGNVTNGHIVMVLVSFYAEQIRLSENIWFCTCSPYSCNDMYGWMAKNGEKLLFWEKNNCSNLSYSIKASRIANIFLCRLFGMSRENSSQFWWECHP